MVKFDRVKKVVGAEETEIKEGYFYVVRKPQEDESLFECVISEDFGMTLEAKKFLQEIGGFLVVRAVKIGSKMILVPIRS